MLEFIVNNSVADKVINILAKIGNYIPEVMLMSAIVLLVLVDLIFTKKENKKWILGVLSLAIIAAVLGFLIIDSSLQDVNIFIATKIILLIATMGCMLLVMNESVLLKPGESYVLIIGILMGSFFLINSETLLTLYLSIEVMSISAYILTVLRFDKRSAEAGLKYILFGATSSAIMLFGMSLIYGFSGSIVLSQIDVNNMIAAVGVYPAIVAFGMVSIGLLFKIAAAPQHIWSPDVYQHTNTSIVAYFSIVPKIAGIMAFFVLLKYTNIPKDWVLTLLSIVAIGTMIIGNFAALWQQDIKRMLAYSSIAHTGFLLIPVIINSHTAWQSFCFYIIIYMVMNIAAFGLVMKLEKSTNTLNIKNYAGLGKAIPFIGILLLIVMLSLTGLPPTAGFTAKLFMFSSIWELYSSSGDLMLLSLLMTGVLNTVIALFYYLKIPYYMFIKTAVKDDFVVTKKANLLNYFVALMVFMLLLLFFKPDWLMELIYNINFDL